MSRTLFVGDVHLKPRRPETWRPFLDLLERDCDVLYLLGDTFDYWVNPSQVDSGEYGEALAAIRRKAARSKVFFLRGNRDYLAEGKFARAAGVTLLEDRVRVDLGGRRVLAAHGDFLYNKNPKYTAYRTMMRSKPVGALWRQVPSAVGKALARGFKAVSSPTTPRVEWTREELADRARPLFAAGTDILICGHIHQPRHLEMQVDGRRCDLFILGDWAGGTRDYVEHDGRGFRFTRG
jgi:UDP-2,3-diacylglucosamine hydrolase